MATAEPARRGAIDGYKHGRVPRALREQQMLDVAEEVFTEYGYDGGSIEEICRRAGLKRPLFYTYFGGKEGLYLACYRRARAELDQRLAAAGTATSNDESTPEALREVLDRLVRAYFDFLAASPSRWDMLYGAGAAAAGPIADEISRLRMATVDLLAAVISPYLSPGTNQETILAFAHSGSGSCEQLARWWRRNPQLTIDRLVELATGYNWAGMAQLLAPKS
jgi:AcrR family transcriptional regulator